MQAAQVDAIATREHLERVLESAGFARNERLSRFLRFVVEWHLEGRSQELKESVIGIEVFGRKPDYDSKRDPIVRTEARRLRARLAAYYDGVGAGDALVIDLPKGGYVPVVRWVEPKPKQSLSPRPRLFWAAIALAFATVALALVGWGRLGPGDRAYSRFNPEVYNLFLRARSFEMQPDTKGVEDSIDLFEQVLGKARSFAPAYAGIAAGYAARSAFDRFSPDERADMIAKGWAAAGKALKSDRRSADAYDALGMMQARQAQWGPAERSFQRAIEIAPRDPLWRDHFAIFFLLPLGRIEEAVGQLRCAEELEPGLALTHIALSGALRAAGRFDEADGHCHKAAENDRARSACWAETLLRQGKTDQALRILEAEWAGHLLQAGAQVLGVAYARAGRREDAERIAALLPRPAGKVSIYAALRDKDRTFELLNEMVPMGPTRIGRDLTSPRFAFLQGDPRLYELRRKVGLPN